MIENQVELSYFTCPQCGGEDFGLVYLTPLTAQDLADAEAEDPDRAAQLRVAHNFNDSNLYATCLDAECGFRISVTDVEIRLAFQSNPA